MAISEVNIINDALGELGEPSIVSRSDNTAQANAADRFFDQAKREFLEERGWRFASKQVQLARLATAPSFKYAYAYQIPVDFIRLIELNEVDVEDVRVPLYEKVGDQIHTDETTVKIVYVYDADVSLFTPSAAMAMAFKLADKMARLLTDSASQKEEMAMRYEKAVKKAKSIDSMHQRQPIDNKAAYSAFILAHGGSGIPEVTSTESPL